jgi:hypothetical protein
MRVVTDTPVTTRAVAKATRESGGEAPLGAWLTALASRFAVYRGVVHARCDRPPRGSVAPPVASLRDVGRADVRWRRGNSLAPDLCAIRVLEGRPIALRQAARRQAITRPGVRGTDLKPRVLLGASASMRVSSATPGYLNPGTRRASHRSAAGRRDRVHSGRRQPTTTERPLKRGKVAV